jgi:hypothetical protein
MSPELVDSVAYLEFRSSEHFMVLLGHEQPGYCQDFFLGLAGDNVR